MLSHYTREQRLVFLAQHLPQRPLTGCRPAKHLRAHMSSVFVGAQRVHAPNNQLLGFWVIVIMVQALGKHMIIRYLDPQGWLDPVRLSSLYEVLYPKGRYNLTLYWAP